MKHRGFYSILNGTVLSKKMNDNAWNSWQQNVFTCRWPKCYTVCPSNFGRCGSLAAFKDGLLQRLALVFKIFSFLCPLPGKEASLKLTILEKASSFTIKSTTQKKKKVYERQLPCTPAFVSDGLDGNQIYTPISTLLTVYNCYYIWPPRALALSHRMYTSHLSSKTGFDSMPFCTFTAASPFKTKPNAIPLSSIVQLVRCFQKQTPTSAFKIEYNESLVTRF